MAFDLSAPDNLFRSNQVLADADALLAGTAGAGGSNTSTSTAALGSLGALDLTDIGSGTADDVASTLNQGVQEVHQTLEALADQNGIAGSVHGLTNLGGTLGFGHIGQGGNLVSDLLGATHGVASGNTGVVGSIVDDIHGIEGAAAGLVSGALADAGVNSGALGLLPDTGTIATAPVDGLVNGIINDFHAELEIIAHSTPLNGTIHGVVGLGNDIGLGTLGGSNLLTDLEHLPGDLLSGNLASLEHVPSDVGEILTGVEGVVSGVLADVGNVGNLSNPVGALGGLVDGLSNGGLDGTLNGIIDEVHATLETIGHSTPLNGTIHGVTGLGNSVGLGDLGGSNLLTDATHLPGALASGDLTPVTNLPGDVGSIVGAIGNLANGVGADIAGNPLTGTLEHPATGGGLLGGNLPGQGVLGTLTGEADSLLDGAHGAAGGLAGTIGGLTGGGLTSGGLVGHLADQGHGLLGTVGSTISGLTNGGHLGGVGGAVDGITGALNGSGGAGSHDLATVTVGPQTPTSGLQVDVLSQGGGATHPVDVHIGTVPAETPTVANVGVLTGGAFHFPTAPAAGGDALSGLASTLGASASHATSAGAPAAVSAIDAPPAAHADVPAAAAAPHPLEALAHPIAHAA